MKFCAVFLIYTHVNYHKTWFHNNENKYKNNPYMWLVLMLQQFWRLWTHEDHVPTFSKEIAKKEHVDTGRASAHLSHQNYLIG